MSANVGSIDRILRAIVGVVLIALVFVGPVAAMGWPRIVVGVVGAVMLLTAAIRFCPAYTLIGVRTRRSS